MKQIARATIPLALLLAWPLSCAAADLPRGVGMPPDTGRVLHELEPRRQIVTGAERPKIDTNVPESAQADGNLRARISHVVYDCAELDVAAESADRVGGLMGAAAAH